MRTLAAIFVLSVCAQAQLWSGVLDPTRAVDWTQMGAGAIPTNYVQVASTIAAYTGTVDAINSALAQCNGSGQYVLLGPGTFNLSAGGTNGGIRITKNKCVLRGSGPTQTKLVFSSFDACGGAASSSICMISGTQSWDTAAVPNLANWTAGFAQGSTQITLSANVSGSTSPGVGFTLYLDQLKDGSDHSADTGNIFECMGGPNLCTQSGGGGDSSRSGRAQIQEVTVTSVVGGSCVSTSPCTVNISPAIYMPNWRSSQSPQAWWEPGPEPDHQGVENLSVDGSAVPGTPWGMIGMQGVTNAWIKNVIGINVHAEAWPTTPSVPAGQSSMVRVYGSNKITVRDSYFVGRKTQDPYGINPVLACDVLIENNIFQHIGMPVVNEQSCGNVYGYNYTVRDIWGPDNGTWAQGAFYGHGGQEHYSLSEGNIAFSDEFENYYGEGFFITAFRNRFTGFQQFNTAQTVPIMTYALNRYFNVIGNVLGVSGRHTNYQDVATSSSTSTPGNNFCPFSIYAIGLGGNCNDGPDASHPPNDPPTVTTFFRWANYDVVTGTNRFCGDSSDTGWSTTCGSTAEVPTGLSLYAQPKPTKGDTAAGQSALPASFYLSSKPSWWPSGKAWPNIGPDVTGGNLGQCASNSTYPYAQCIIGNANACGTGFACGSAGVNLQVISNPAMDCYASLGGLPSGDGPVLTNFDANVCYAASPGNPAVSLNPGSVVFASQLKGSTSSAQSVVLLNSGTATLNFTSITASADFGQSNNCGGSLGAGLSCTLNVTFTPSSVGMESGSVTIADDASGSPHTVTLSGTGVAPTVQFLGGAAISGAGTMNSQQ
jgi:hypothetical protein